MCSPSLSSDIGFAIVHPVPMCPLSPIELFHRSSEPPWDVLFLSESYDGKWKAGDGLAIGCLQRSLSVEDSRPT